MAFQKTILSGALSCAAISASAFLAAPVQAACLTSIPGSPSDNNCVTYDTTGSPTKATLYYTDTNLTNPNWQLQGATSTIANFSNWEYGSNGTNWTSFDPGFATNGGFQVGTIFTSSTTPTAPAGNPFYIRVTLSDTATISSAYSFTLYTNNNGDVDGNGLLSNNASNNYSALTRSFTRVADPAPPAGTPGPLPLMGAAAAFGYSRKIRKAIRAIG